MARISCICEPVIVLPVSERYFEPLDPEFTLSFFPNDGVRPVPVGLVPSPLPPTRGGAEEPATFELFTFYNWLRTGFRIVPNASAHRFEVYKGMGLLLPGAYRRYQPTIQRLYGYQLLAADTSDDAHYKILELGSERRIAGVADLSLLRRDLRGYRWMNDCAAARTPRITGAFSFSNEYCSRHAVPAGSCGHIIRRFLNPFRITDLQLMRKMAGIGTPAPDRCSWLAKAEEILSLSMDLLGTTLGGYLAGVGNALGRTAGALSCLRILHGQLTDHCQNITLGGELTEFDLSIREDSDGTPPQDYDSRLFSQILLIANQLRHLVDCIRWIGIDCGYRECLEPFLAGVKEVIAPRYAEFVYHLNHDPYCLDLSLSSRNRYSEENLSGSGEFLSVMRYSA